MIGLTGDKCIGTNTEIVNEAVLPMTEIMKQGDGKGIINTAEKSFYRGNKGFFVWYMEIKRNK